MSLNMKHTITTIWRILYILILEKEVSLVQVKAGFTFLNKLKEKEK